MRQDVIPCQIHDYIEIACLYGYRVKLILKDGRSLEGTAIDTFTSAEKREYLLLDNGRQQQLELNQVHKMEVLTANAKFKSISFND